MIVRQSKQFEKFYKKLAKNELESVNKAVQSIIDNPLIGEMNKGDLNGVRVLKFKLKDLIYLLAYEGDEDIVLLIAIGVHENFYRDLKR